jgi:ubiquinone/menaquinone biosynthesis C-methylase UbiE
MSSSSTKSTPERLRQEFNEWARAGKGESMEKGHRPIGEQAIALMRVDRDGRILDVGCGSGWATRLMAQRATEGRVVGIDISDEMVELARSSSGNMPNVEFHVASAEALPFSSDEFTHAFSMESLYYYADISAALTEIHRVLRPKGQLAIVVDLYLENVASHQWVEQLNVPVQLLSSLQYRMLLETAGFVNVNAGRLYDRSPIPPTYTGSSFKSYEDYVSYRRAGSLLLTCEAGK